MSRRRTAIGGAVAAAAALVFGATVAAPTLADDPPIDVEGGDYSTEDRTEGDVPPAAASLDAVASERDNSMEEALANPSTPLEVEAVAELDSPEDGQSGGDGPSEVDGQSGGEG